MPPVNLPGMLYHFETQDIMTQPLVNHYLKEVDGAQSHVLVSNGRSILFFVTAYLKNKD